MKTTNFVLLMAGLWENTRRSTWKKLVYPYEDVEILVDMVAPPRPETAVSYWHLVNDKGETFYTVSIRIEAILRPTATKTPK